MCLPDKIRFLCFFTPFISYHFVLFFFFFQAEDGIRDYKVTGVQTCALPISSLSTLARTRNSPPSARAMVRDRLLMGRSRKRAVASEMESAAKSSASAAPKIGRASCRERV